MKTRIVFSAVVVIVLVAGSAWASVAQGPDRTEGRPQAAAVSLELVGQIGGPVNAVAVQGSYAYIGVGPRLVVLNISNPASPAFVGQSNVLDGIVRDVAVSGSTAYVADGSGLKVFNVSNPAAPAQTGYYDSPGTASGLTVIGTTLCLADGEAGLRIVNVANPAAPTSIGSRDTPGYAWDVKVAGSYAYVADGDAGLRVINVSNLTSPAEVGFLAISGIARGLALDGSAAYVAADYGGLVVIDVSNPAAPREMSVYAAWNSHDISGAIVDVVIDNAYAYVAEAEVFYQDDLYRTTYGGGLRIIDVADPAQPAWVGFCDTGGNPKALALAGGRAYVADGRGGFSVIDVTVRGGPTEQQHEDTGGTANAISMLDDLQFGSAHHFVADGADGLRMFYGYWHKNYLSYYSEVGHVDTPGYAYDVLAVNDRVYVADGNRGLRIINPSSSTEIGFCETPNLAVGVAVSGTYAYVADADSGLRVIDVHDAAHPAEVGFHDTAGTAHGVAIRGNHVFVADGDDGLRVISVADPAHPVEVGFRDTPGYAEAVALAGSRAYVADRGGGLRIMSIANPAAPTEIAFFDTPGQAQDVVVQGRFAYVADGAYGLRVINVRDPAHPADYGAFDTEGNARGVDVAGYVGVADAPAGIWLIDVSQLLDPVQIGHYDTLGAPQRLDIGGHYVHLTAGAAGLRIVDVSTPENPTAVGTYVEGSRRALRDVITDAAYDYIADDDGGLVIVNVSNPQSPTGVTRVVGSYEFTDWPLYGGPVAVAGGYAYVAGCVGYAAIGIIDVSEPETAFAVRGYNPADCPWDIEATPGYLYFTTRWFRDGLNILDVSDPNAPAQIGFSDLPNEPVGVDVVGNYSYVTDSSGLHIISVVNPAAPAPVGFWDGPDGAGDVVVAGSHAYVVGATGLHVVDVSNPALPVEIASYDTLGSAGDVAVSGSYAYVADGEGGLVVLRLTSDGTATPTPTPTRTPGATTITLQNGLNGYAGASDTWMDEWRPTQNFNQGADVNFIRLYTDGHQNSLIRFDLSLIPAGAIIQSARLDVKIGSRTNANSLVADLFRVKREWIDTEATWQRASTAQEWEAAGAGGSSDRSTVSEGTLTLNAAGGTWVSADVTTLVQYWVDHPSDNYGALLRPRAGGGVQYALRSSDHPEQVDRPKLIVQYTAPTATHTPTATPSATSTATVSPTPTETATATSSRTPTPSPTVTGTVLAPDLVVSSVQPRMQGYTGGCVIEYGPTVLHICVGNPGTGPAGAFAVQAGSCISPTEELRLTGLGAGATDCVETAGSPAAWVICDVVADPYDEVAESNESNNTWSGPVPMVTPPPLCTVTPTATATPPRRAVLPLLVK